MLQEPGVEVLLEPGDLGAVIVMRDGFITQSLAVSARALGPGRGQRVAPARHLVEDEGVGELEVQPELVGRELRVQSDALRRRPPFQGLQHSLGAPLDRRSKGAARRSESAGVWPETNDRVFCASAGAADCTAANMTLAPKTKFTCSRERFCRLASIPIDMCGHLALRRYG